MFKEINHKFWHGAYAEFALLTRFSVKVILFYLNKKLMLSTMNPTKSIKNMWHSFKLESVKMTFMGAGCMEYLNHLVTRSPTVPTECLNVGIGHLFKPAAFKYPIYIPLNMQIILAYYSLYRLTHSAQLFFSISALPHLKSIAFYEKAQISIWVFWRNRC